MGFEEEQIGPVEEEGLREYSQRGIEEKGAPSSWNVELSGFLVANYQTCWEILNRMRSNFDHSFSFQNIELTGPKLEKISVSIEASKGKVRLTEKKKRNFKLRAELKFSEQSSR
jgi:hypothetical protein